MRILRGYDDYASGRIRDLFVQLKGASAIFFAFNDTPFHAAAGSVGEAIAALGLDEVQSLVLPELEANSEA